MGRSSPLRTLWLLSALALFPAICQCAGAARGTDVKSVEEYNQAQGVGANVQQEEPLQSQQIDEGTRAYLEALQHLEIISTSPSSPGSSSSSSSSDTSFLSSFLPSRYGVFGSLFRFLSRLGQWAPLRGKQAQKSEEMRWRALKVVELLGFAVERGSLEALQKLADISMIPPASLPVNLTRSYHSYQKHASLTGNPQSQAMLAFFHAVGYGDIALVDQAQALLYYTFAALGGDQGAKMALGYRHWAGIGVPEVCMTALDWYEAAAEQAMANFLTGPPGGRTLPLTPTRLADLVGGVYGPGSSVASTGYNANKPAVRAGHAQAAGETWDEILEFYQYHTDQGEGEYTLRLGKIYYHGTLYMSASGASSSGDAVGAVVQDFWRARGYFLRIARQVWPRDNVDYSHAPIREVDDHVASWAGQAAAYLGRMYLRGEGVKQDVETAKKWFERGAALNDRECQNGLGIVWRDFGKDHKKAIEYFAEAAGQDLAEAQIQLGKYHLENGDINLAVPYFDIALRHGSPFEAYYYLAHIHANNARAPTPAGTTSSGSCAAAVSFYKVVAERGSWGNNNDLMGEAERRWARDTPRDRNLAMLYWYIAAEMGYETAQNNLAFILDQEGPHRPRPSGWRKTPSNSTGRIALVYWTRSAAQNNIDALVKVGDYHFHGVGMRNESEVSRWEKAAGYYQSAVETQLSALAMWNLGWMYENGLGVLQDFHLAKRYYDMALETNREAYLPVFLSLLKLYARSLYHIFSGGNTHGLTLWLGEGADDHWYLGKTGADQKRKAGRQTLGEGVAEGEDAVEWIQQKTREAHERGQGDLGPDDYLYDREGAADEDASKEFTETLVLLVLCGLVAWLIYVRSQWAARRAEEERRRRANMAEVAAQQGGGPIVAPPVEAAPDPLRDFFALFR